MTVRTYRKTIFTCECGQTMMFTGQDYPEEWAKHFIEDGTVLIRVGIDEPICPKCGIHYNTGPAEVWESGHTNFEIWLKGLDHG